MISAYFGSAEKNVDANALAFDGETIWQVGHNDTDGLWKAAIRQVRSYAFGSGTAHALTAMDMGATAAEAVEMAKRRNICTGGQVRTLLIGEAAANGPPSTSQIAAGTDGVLAVSNRNARAVVQTAIPYVATPRVCRLSRPIRTRCGATGGSNP